MAKKSKLLSQLKQHYQMWTDDNQKRLTRKGGWNDITDAYYGQLPNDWPYISRTVDPRIRTSLIEKNARLMGGKLRGTFVPREGGDTLGAHINNAIIDYQWDSANDGGSMVTKMSIVDIDARLYQSKFVLVPWRLVLNHEGEVQFEGNEMIPLDIRDCGLDPSATHIRDAKWFQHRTWEHVDDLEMQTDSKGKPLFKNIGELKTRLAEKTKVQKSSTKNEYVPRRKQLQGIEDRTGEDRAFPVIKLVTEYREDKWITFAPDFDLVLREIDNPYEHNKIPVAQLRYYPVQDDNLGESEVEPVIPLWKGIQAVLCSYMDEVILKMRPPIKIIENAVRIETIQYGPEAQWLVDRQDAIEEMKSSGDSLAYFQTTYQVLISAFNTAMGDLSQGSAIDPFSNDSKTATEVKASNRQQNVRDQKNQNDLSEFIKDIVSMWCANNKQFLFSDPNKVDHIVRIVGKDKYQTFERAGYADRETPNEMIQMIADMVEQNPDMTEEEINSYIEEASIPKHPILLNPKEKDITKYKVKPKMTLSEFGNMAELSVVPEDMDGTYDYVPDVKSMSASYSVDAMSARQQAMELFTSNPVVLQLLQEEGFRPEIKQIITSTLEGLGMRDAERFFRKLEDGQANPEQAAQQEAQGIGGALNSPQVAGIPGVPQTPPNGGLPEPMAGSQQGQDGGGVPQAI